MSISIAGILLGASAAYGATDFSFLNNYSREELVELQAEIDARLNSISLSAGTYIVGEDFPSGSYDITADVGFGLLKVYASYDAFTSGDYYHSYSLMPADFPTYEKSKSMFSPIVHNVVFRDGMCIVDKGISVTLMPVETQ